MKKLISLALGLLISHSALTHAQSRFSANSYLGDPEQYLGKSVTIYVDRVDVPAINATTDDSYRVFFVHTMGRDGNDYVPGGWIYVKVPKGEAGAFAKRHNNPNKMVAKNVSGRFSEWPAVRERGFGDNPTQEQVWTERCYRFSKYYISCE